MDVLGKARQTLGANIRRARRQSGLSQEALADAIDTAQSLVSLIERGQVDTSFSKVVQIARALEVGVHDLVIDCYEAPSNKKRNRPQLRRDDIRELGICGSDNFNS